MVVLRIFFESIKWNGKFVILAQKWALEENIDIIFKSKRDQCYFLYYRKDSSICQKPHKGLMEFTQKSKFRYIPLPLIYKGENVSTHKYSQSLCT